MYRETLPLGLLQRRFQLPCEHLRDSLLDSSVYTETDIYARPISFSGEKNVNSVQDDFRTIRSP
jgi:hypothetical protein